jgi:hypothetical protein
VVVRAAPDVPVEEAVSLDVPWPPVVLPFEPELLAVPLPELLAVPLPEMLAVPLPELLVIADDPPEAEPAELEVPMLPEMSDRQQPPGSTRIATALILITTAAEVDHE